MSNEDPGYLIEANLFGYNLRMFRRRGLDNVPRAKPGDQGGGRDNYATQWEWLQRQLAIEAERTKRYDLYYRMDMTDVVSMVADQYAEDACSLMPSMRRFVVTAKNAKVRNALQGMWKNLKGEEHVYSWMRELALMGDIAERTVYARGSGIKALQHADARKFKRSEDKYSRLLGFEYEGSTFRDDGKNKVSYPWDFIHFRNMGRNRETPYGTSLFFAAIRPWKQLIMAEDEQLFYRMNRRPDVDLWKVDTGTNDEIEGRKILRRFMKEYKKDEFQDPKNGEYQYQFKPKGNADDIFLSVTEGSMSDVTRLSGNPSAGEITDLIYYLDKYFGSVACPKEMFGFLGDNSGNVDIDRKKKLTSQNIIYARRVARLQHSFKIAMRELCEIHLDLLDQNPESLEYDYTKDGNGFDFEMEPVSYLTEYERLDLMMLRANVAATIATLFPENPNVDGYEWTKFILTDVLQLGTTKVDDMLTRAYQQTDDADPDNAGLQIPEIPPPAPPVVPGSAQAGQRPQGPQRPQAGQQRRPGSGLPSKRRLAKEEIERMAAAKGDLDDTQRGLLIETLQNSPDLLALLHRSSLLFSEPMGQRTEHAMKIREKKGELKDTAVDPVC